MSEYNRHKWAMEWMHGGGRDPNGRSLDDEIRIGKEDWLESQRVAQGRQLVQPGPRMGFDQGGTAEVIKYLNTLPDNTKITKEMITDYVTKNNLKLNVQNFLDKQVVNRSPRITSKIAYETKVMPLELTDEVLTQLDNYIKKTEMNLQEIGKKIGRRLERGGSILTKYEEIYGTIPETRFKPFKFTKESPKVKEIFKLYDEGISKNAIAKKLGLKRPNIIEIFHKFRPEDVGKAEVAGEVTSKKKSKEKARANIKLAQTKAGIKTTKQADQVIDRILSQNEIYQKMSVEDIAKDKDFLKRLRVQIDVNTGEVTFDGYTKKRPVGGKVFTDLELAQHAKNRAMTYELVVPDHITPKGLRKQNVGYPINFQSATYMENSHLDNGRKYLLKNPDGNWKPIDNYLSSNNLTIRGPEFKQKYGFKLPIKFNPETGTSNIVELSFKKTVPIVKQTKLVSFPANLADVKWGKNLKGWRGGAVFEGLVGILDYWNETSKGKKGGYGSQAMATAIQTATLGLLKTGDKKYEYELIKLGKEMGFDTTALEHVIDINKRDNVLAKVQDKHAAQVESFQKALDEETNPEVKEKQQEYFNDLKMRFAREEKLRAEETNKIFDTYIEDLRAKKAGPVQLVSPEKLAATDITQEEANLPFENLWTTATEQLRKEKEKAFPEASKRLDYEAGVIGDPLQTHIFNVPAWSAEHEAFGLWNKTPKQEERAHLNSLIKLAEEGNPEPLREYNERRGVYEDQPITTQSLKNLTERYPWLGYRVEEAEGGIASLLKK